MAMVNRVSGHGKNVKLTTWNISGVKHNINFLRTCLSMCDILCLQEHWLFQIHFIFLTLSISTLNHGADKAATFASTHCNRRRERDVLVFTGDKSGQKYYSSTGTWK